MELPDFLHFDAFNALRTRMGAERLGQFEFFDPDLHLTADERARLAESGVDLGWSHLRCLQDYSLVYKNSRVLLLPYDDALVPQYHLAYCRVLQAQARREPGQRFLVASGLLGRQGWQVCGDCLQQLQFEGYDGARTRHRDYSERVRERFQLAEYLERYPLYPIRTSDLRAARREQPGAAPEPIEPA